MKVQICGQGILIDQILMHNQLNIYNVGAMDVVNAIFQEVKTALKKIASPHAFVENEQWMYHRCSI
jgi:hypothetical protein